MKIGIVGSGISGLTVANRLSSNHDITVFESEPLIGGHTATRDVEIQGQEFAVDTGFIVYNDWTYPNFIQLMSRLGIESQTTEMGFSVTAVDGTLEYCGSSLNAIFSDRKNLINPAFLGMVRDIVRFNKKSVKDLSNGHIVPGQTLRDYLREGKFGKLFIDGYIVPMACAIWSASSSTVEDFEALFFIRFFRNHGLLNINDRPQWRVLKNGSRSYLPAITEPFKKRIHTGTPIRRITRAENGVRVNTDSAEHHFDHVVIACHSNQALSILGDADSAEREVLSAIPYSDNTVTMHTDTTVLPRRKRAWSSWNYLIRNNNRGKPILTYNMNILQSLAAPETICVTVNGDRHIDPNKILARFSYAHPQFSVASIKAQKKWSTINGTRKTWFCGAYWGSGFHEDGVTSGIRIAESIESTP